MEMKRKDIKTYCRKVFLKNFEIFRKEWKEWNGIIIKKTQLHNRTVKIYKRQMQQNG